jgi:hypothetical protein
MFDFIKFNQLVGGFFWLKNLSGKGYVKGKSISRIWGF